MAEEPPQAENEGIFLCIQARHDASEGYYCRAFDGYFKSFSVCPPLKSGMETELREVMEKFNEYLRATNKTDEIFLNFKRALIVYPNNAEIISDLGRYLYNYKFMAEAFSHFTRALRLNPGLVSAEKFLNSTKSFLVPHWHFRMLNDKVRNTAFHDGILQTVEPKDLILDIGTGTGLLALYAAETKSKGIVACDDSKLMANIAKSTFESHNYSIPVFGKLSTQMFYEAYVGQYSLVITELFDAGLLGEHILETLEHAWKHLMVPNGKVLPQSATFYVAAARCDLLSFRYRLTPAALKHLGLTGREVHVENKEPYDTEDLCLFNELKYVTEPKTLFNINFNSLEEVLELLHNDKPHEVELEVTMDEEVNIIVGWFDLHITDKIILTTDPRAENKATAWQQPIFYDFIPKTMKQGEILKLQFTTNGSKLKLVQDDAEVIRVSQPLVRFLNDDVYMKSITESISPAFVYLCQVCEVEYFNLMDLSPFPLFGLLMMKRGSGFLTCYAKTPNDKKLIVDTFKKYNIPKSKLQILTDEKIHVDYMKVKKYHAVVSNLLELNGDINIKQKCLMLHVKEHLVIPEAVSMPLWITIEVQLIYSEWVEDTNFIFKANAHNYNIDLQCNNYQVSQNFDVDIMHLKYKAMSEAKNISHCSENMEPAVLNIVANDTGPVNALLVWYRIQFQESEDIFYTNRANSHINATLFRTNPAITVTDKENVTLLKCVDEDQSFKFIIDR